MHPNCTRSIRDTRATHSRRAQAAHSRTLHAASWPSLSLVLPSRALAPWGLGGSNHSPGQPSRPTSPTTSEKLSLGKIKKGTVGAGYSKPIVGAQTFKVSTCSFLDPLDPTSELTASHKQEVTQKTWHWTAGCNTRYPTSPHGSCHTAMPGTPTFVQKLWNATNPYANQTPIGLPGVPHNAHRSVRHHRCETDNWVSFSKTILFNASAEAPQFTSENFSFINVGCFGGSCGFRGRLCSRRPGPSGSPLESVVRRGDNLYPAEGRPCCAWKGASTFMFGSRSSIVCVFSVVTNSSYPAFGCPAFLISWFTVAASASCCCFSRSLATFCTGGSALTFWPTGCRSSAGGLANVSLSMTLIWEQNKNQTLLLSSMRKFSTILLTAQSATCHRCSAIPLQMFVISSSKMELTNGYDSLFSKVPSKVSARFW
mmetsp:Transcript_9601/g.14787  ORF Transcript_9601/g.14787 Transcript_9601/m.14787 type:complete len:426 (+) Transcript_9601:164-1441(+)